MLAHNYRINQNQQPPPTQPQQLCYPSTPISSSIGHSNITSPQIAEIER